MHHPMIGFSPRKTDTVARAMEILKDRPMFEPKADPRHNFVRNSNRAGARAANLHPPK
jgi:hypothetical protein